MKTFQNVTLLGSAHLWTVDLTSFAHNRVETAFKRFASRIRSISIRLSDVNGPRGGVDKRCQVELSLTRWGSVRSCADAENEYAAITTAIERARMQLLRRLRRTRRKLTRDSFAAKRAGLLARLQMSETASMARSTDGHHMPELRVYPHVKREQVRLGSTVVVRDLHSNEVESYKLVNASDADIVRNWISSFAPAGRAFYGASVGDVVTVNAPGGHFRFRIEAVNNDGQCPASEIHSQLVACGGD